MKTYLSELRGQVRGNARLRRRLNASHEMVVRLEAHLAALVTLADKAGYGDTIPVVRAAAAIGWVRFTKDQREWIRRELEAVS